MIPLTNCVADTLARETGTSAAKEAQFKNRMAFTRQSQILRLLLDAKVLSLRGTCGGLLARAS